ncbi:hypothetical protein LINGRAHAP2_LOCUS34099 [Linum grandiflorum]
MTCFAASGEEMMTLVTSPNWSCITGPCFRASSLSRWWVPRGLIISWWRLPITGSFHGPGGAGAVALAFCFFRNRTISNNVKPNIGINISVSVLIY